MNDEKFIKMEDIDDNSQDELSKVISEFEGRNKLYERVISEIVEDSEDYEGTELERIKMRLDDISQGLVNGTVSSLIYYSDTLEFFEEYNDELWDLFQKLEDSGVEPLEGLKRSCSETSIIMCSDNVNNWAVWTAYEEIAYEFSNAIESL